MWENKKVSVIFPAYNEERNIFQAIQDFSQPCIDEIIVVDNNSTDNTRREVARTRAILVKEEKQGYGYAIRKGLEKAEGDYLIIAEPDATFLGRDVYKLLSYAKEFDLVLGTRTRRELIWPEANMGPFLRLGNIAVAKLMQLLFIGPKLTDVGCTFRLIRREALVKVKDKFKVGGSHFSPEMMVLAIVNGLKVFEVPVNYRGRIGISKITGKKGKTLKLGLRMIFMIIYYRLITLLKKR